MGCFCLSSEPATRYKRQNDTRSQDTDLSWRPEPRRDDGVVERAGLENRCAREGTGGSNPPLSAFLSPFTARPCAPNALPAGVCDFFSPPPKERLQGSKRLMRYTFVETAVARSNV